MRRETSHELHKSSSYSPACAELQEHDIVAPTLQRALESGEDSIVYLRQLWGHRRMLSRVAVGALLTSMLIAFLIAARYESTLPFESSASRDRQRQRLR